MESNMISRTNLYRPPQTTPTESSSCVTFILVLLAVGFQLVDRFMLSSETQAAATSTATSDSKLSRRFSIDIGNTRPFGFSVSTIIALSADGSKLAYSVRRPNTGDVNLYLKNLDQQGEQELFSEYTNSIFFSPDGEELGLKSIAIAKRFRVSKSAISKWISKGRKTHQQNNWSDIIG
jgi:hypothetical protein